MDMVSVADKLPIEVVSHILSYLRVSDRKDSALVCKKWYEASLHPALVGDLVVMLGSAKTGPALRESLKLLNNRSGIHLSLSDITDMVDADSIMQSCQPALCYKLSSLDLAGCSISEQAFAAVIGSCVNLHTLDLSSCNSLLLSGRHLIDQLAQVQLPKLVSLNLSSLRHLSDATLCALLGITPKLEALNLTSVPMLFGSVLTLSNIDGRPSSAAVTFAGLLSEIQRLASTLRSLNLSRTGITDDCLKSLTQIDKLNISCLEIVACKDMTNGGVTVVAEAIPELQSLNLAYNTQLGDEALRVVALNLTKLKHLDVKNVPLGPGCMKYLRMLPVGSLVMSGCLKVDLPPVVADDTVGEWVKNLTRLDLSGCPGLSRETLSGICSRLVRLEHLALRSCFHVDDAVVRDISKNLTGLTRLSISWCTKVTDFGLCGLVDKEFSHHHSTEAQCRCSRAEISSRRNVPLFFYDSPSKSVIPDIIPTKEQISESLASVENDQPYPLFRLTGLTHLDLSGCRKLSDNSLTMAIRLPALIQLDLSLCSRITDDSLTTIAKHSPLLQTLSLGSCRGITDNGLRVVFRSCRRLSHLSVDNCRELTDITVNEILDSGISLKYFDVSYCNISTIAIHRLQLQLPYLRTVHKRYTSYTDH